VNYVFCVVEECSRSLSGLGRSAAEKPRLTEYRSESTKILVKEFTIRLEFFPILAPIPLSLATNP